MDLEPVISQDILLLSPPHVNKCVSPRVRRTNCSVFASASTVNICKEVEHFVLCSFQHPAPSSAAGVGDDETRREPLTVEQWSSRPRMRGGVSRECSGRGAAARGQDPGPVSGHPHAAAALAGRWAGRYAVPWNRRVSAFRVKHYWVQFSEAARRYVAGSPLRSWAVVWPHCVLHQPAAVADQLQLLSPFSAASPATTTTLDTKKQWNQSIFYLASTFTSIMRSAVML